MWCASAQLILVFFSVFHSVFCVTIETNAKLARSERDHQSQAILANGHLATVTNGHHNDHDHDDDHDEGDAMGTAFVQTDAVNKLKSVLHAWGVESEHSGDQSKWELTDEDKEHQKKFLLEMNNPDGNPAEDARAPDTCYKWHDVNCCFKNPGETECRNNCSWTWNEVTNTAKTPKEALVRHLLHRHGIGALLASRAGMPFEQVHARNIEEHIANSSYQCCCKKATAITCNSTAGYEQWWEESNETKTWLWSVPAKQGWCCSVSESCGWLATNLKNIPDDANKPALEKCAKRLPPGLPEVEALVGSIEKSDEFTSMRALLLKFSFSGIRNLHSFDHIWSVRKGSGIVPKCAEDAGSCVLQAGTSKKADALMTGNGFTEQATAAAITRCYRWIYARNVISTYLPFSGQTGSSFQSNYMTPYHTGNHTISGSFTKPANRKQKASTCQGSASVSGSYIVGQMCWEFGGKTELNVPVTAAETEKINAAGQDKEKMIIQIIDKYIAEQEAGNKKYMEENRLLLWAGEEAEFADMCRAFKTTPFKVSSPPTCAERDF